MTRKRSNSSNTPEVAIELPLDTRLLEFAFSDNGEGDPERLLIELEEAGDLSIVVNEYADGTKQIDIIYENAQEKT